MLQIGDRIPPFSAIDAEGTPITAEDLLGSLTVIYFYPKDETPGCTKEACSFRDGMNELDERGVIILGISPDGMESHQRFIEKHHLPFSLLVDENKELCSLFGVVKGNAIERTTFLVDDKGIIRWLERPVTVEDHLQRIIHAIDAISH